MCKGSHNKTNQNEIKGTYSNMHSVIRMCHKMLLKIFYEWRAGKEEGKLTHWVYVLDFVYRLGICVRLDCLPRAVRSADREYVL